MVLGEKLVRLAQVGYGYWGPNLARNFAQLPGAELTYLVDASAEARSTAQRLYGCQAVATLEEALADPLVDAVVLATPARTHHALGTAALNASKHLFIEKPLAMSVAEGQALVQLAAQRE